MAQFGRKLTRLESLTRQAVSQHFSDDELLEAIEAGTFEGRHLDAVFRVAEPGALGALLSYSRSLRQDFRHMSDHFRGIYAPLEGAIWLVAAGTDIPIPDRYELERWREWLSEPGDDYEGETRLGAQFWRAHMGIARRLFRKHGLENLQAVVRSLTEASPTQYYEIADRIFPRADEARRERMARLTARWRSPATFHHFPLKVLAEDRSEFWHIEDNDGQGWTPTGRLPPV